MESSTRRRGARSLGLGCGAFGLTGSRANGTTLWPSVAYRRGKDVSTPLMITVDVHPARARKGRAGRVAYGVGVAGMGVMILLSGKLASVFQPVPPWVPLRQWLAYVSGALLLASGLALITGKMTRLAALVLTVNFAVWL